MPKISVVIPTYNSANYIKAAIDSVLVQTYNDFEIIVVDDGSHDNTRQIVEANYPQVQYLYQENRGPAAARNNGIKHSNGEFVAFLDADDIWLPEKLELQIREAILVSSVGLVTCGGYIIDYLGGERIELRQINGLSRKALLDSLLIRNIIGGGSYVLVRRKCFEELGGFDESLYVSEDRDMWLRICKEFDFRSVDKPLLKYLMVENSQSSDPQKNIDSQMRFLKKVFSQYDFKKNVFFEKKVYARQYFSCAWDFFNYGNRKYAMRYILKSFYTNPLYFFSLDEHFGLLIRIVFGESIFNLLNKFNRG